MPSAGTLLLLAGGTAQQVERATPVLMAMGNELINAAWAGHGHPREAHQ